MTSRTCLILAKGDTYDVKTTREELPTARIRKHGLLLFSAILFLSGLVGQAGRCFAADVTLAWDANTAPQLAGYKVYIGTTSGSYSTSIDVGKVTTYTVTGLANGTYNFAVTA